MSSAVPTLAIALAIVAVSIILGVYLAKKFRMPDYGWKIGLILFVTLASAWITVTRWPPKLGIDLSGGVILYYQVDPTKKADPNKTLGQQEMEQLIAAVSRRINPGGVKEVTIRTAGVEQIEVIIPEVDQEEANRIKGIIQRAGTLEFRILANRKDHPEIIEQAMGEKSRIVRNKSGRELGRWVPIQAGQEDSLNYPEIARRQVKIGGKDVTEILVVSDPQNVTGEYLTSTRPDIDPKTARPCVDFTFNAQGAERFGRLTSDNLPDKAQDFTRKLGIILDGELYSAPSIQSTIYDRGQITGSFTQKEVEDLVAVLNAGMLPAALTPEPISELYSGPTLGRDTIEKGTRSMLVSAVLVPLFMLWYYRFSGLVANVALFMNMLMLMAIMIAIQARFTLTGLAGLALTVGMAVDNNVLVYERLREELERGATLRMAIRNAFQRASATIIDSNLTTLLAATVLYYIGTDQVKGFAVTLWIGVALSMFTAVFVARVIFDVAEKQRWLTRLRMLRLIGRTNIDFMRLFPVTASISVVVILASLLVAYWRGVGLFDIDFTGGVSVQAVFHQPQDSGELRKQLQDLPDLAISDVQLAGDEPGTRFMLNTSEPDLDKVEQFLAQTFKKQLVTNAVEVKGVRLIEAPPESKTLSPGEKLPAEKPEPQGPAEKPAPDRLEAAKPQPEKAPDEKPAAKPVEEPKPEKPADLPKEQPKPEKPADQPREQPKPEKPADQAKESPQADKPADAPKEEMKPDEPADRPDKEETKSDKPADESDTKQEAKPEKPADAPKEEPKPQKPGNPPKEEPKSEKPAELPAKEDSKSEKPAVPDEREESRRDLPPRTMLAMADTESLPWMLAQASEAAPQGPTADGPAPKNAEKPLEKTPGAAPASSEGLKPAETKPAVFSFDGGTEARLHFAQTINHKSMTDFMTEALKAAGIPPETVAFEITNDQYVEGDTRSYADWTVRMRLPPEKGSAVLDNLQKQVQATPYFPASSVIGGAVAQNTRVQALVALVLSWALMIVYLWVRFQKVAFGVAAVVALVHDVAVMLGAVAVSYYIAVPWVENTLLINQFKINLPIVAAFLTIIGFSANDTIVIFDRIRELRGKDPNLTAKMVNDATNQTLSRTLLTSFTVLLVVAVLYFFGGPAIHGFAFALIAGVFTGTYSSVYVAAPVLLWLVGSKPTRAAE